MAKKTRKRGPWHLCWHEQTKRWKKTVKGKTYYWKCEMQARADLAAIYADARCKDGDENVEFTMPLFLEDSCLYIKLVCIYADFCGYADTLHYEPMTYEEFVAELCDGDDDDTEKAWKDYENERQLDVESKQKDFAWDVLKLAEVASGDFEHLNWGFLQDVWDALGRYGWRDEELEDLYQKLHKAWSRGRKKEEEETKAFNKQLAKWKKEQLT